MLRRELIKNIGALGVTALITNPLVASSVNSPKFGYIRDLLSEYGELMNIGLTRDYIDNSLTSADSFFKYADPFTTETLKLIFKTKCILTFSAINVSRHYKTFKNIAYEKVQLNNWPFNGKDIPEIITDEEKFKLCTIEYNGDIG